MQRPADRGPPKPGGASSACGAAAAAAPVPGSCCCSCAACGSPARAAVLTAPEDGIAPAVLLSLSAGAAAPSNLTGAQQQQHHLRGPQYLFNCPEGFARLALEHGARPGPGLRAVLLISLAQPAAVRAPIGLNDCDCSGA